MRVLFLILIMFFSSSSQSCESQYDLNKKIGYYCHNWRLSFAFAKNEMNEICMKNSNREVNPLSIKKIDDDRYEFSCKLSTKELSDILNKEKQKQANEAKVKSEQEVAARALLIKEAKTKCSSIGYEKGSQKYAKCVLELID